MNTTTLRTAQQHGPAVADIAARSLATGLWAFMGVASSLFTLFLVAYALRMDSPDWSPIALPRQLLLSTCWLVIASLLLQQSAQLARVDASPARLWWLAGGAAATLFLASQLWAWQSLQAARVLLQGNPAGSFFYVLTALHGLHVLGGLVAWGACTPLPAPPPMTRIAGSGAIGASLSAAGDLAYAVYWRMALCARYWHFLLGVWLLLYAALAGLTPEVVRFICGRG